MREPRRLIRGKSVEFVRGLFRFSIGAMFVVALAGIAAWSVCTPDPPATAIILTA
jgi:hypothetical protein